MKIDKPEEISPWLVDLCKHRPGLNVVHDRLAQRSDLFRQMTQGRGKPTHWASSKKG